MTRRVLAARLDNIGDVLLTGPALRALAAAADELVLVCSPTGRAAGELLPGVDRLITFAAPWILGDPPPVHGPAMDDLVAIVRALAVDEAVIFTSFHQSPLPFALLLRLAGVPRISAISVDYPGSLLDVRHGVEDDIHEVDRSCSLVAAAGFPVPADDRALRVAVPPAADAVRATLPDRYVVVHPGCSVPARTWAPERWTALAAELAVRNLSVVVTGGHAEVVETAEVASAAGGVDLGGRLTLAELAAVLDGADVVATGNTGPAHLAAAVGTPVVSLFPPTVPAVRWHPWGVPHALFGDQAIACAGCRATVCPFPGHPCVGGVDPASVADAVAGFAATDRLTAVGVPAGGGGARR